jgi:hypothetical protein
MTDAIMTNREDCNAEADLRKRERGSDARS